MADIFYLDSIAGSIPKRESNAFDQISGRGEVIIFPGVRYQRDADDGRQKDTKKRPRVKNSPRHPAQA